MALGDIQMLSWKSKAKQKQEYEDYVKWAFPYGKEQQDRVQALLSRLFPKEDAATALIRYLTCKELFSIALKKAPYDEAVRDVLGLKKYRGILKKGDMPSYLAVVLADHETDENMDYPPEDELRRRMDELAALEKTFL